MYFNTATVLANINPIFILFTSEVPFTTKSSLAFDHWNHCSFGLTFVLTHFFSALLISFYFLYIINLFGQIIDVFKNPRCTLNVSKPDF